MPIATGSFEVVMHAEPPYSELEGVSLARARVDKRFQGGLDATATVDMLAVRTPDPAARAYVALERIDGTLAGRRGSFVVAHTAHATADAAKLSIAIVVGSGTGELAGITGRIEVQIEGGRHSYELHYELPPVAV